MEKPYISLIHIEYSNLDPVNINNLSPNLNVIYGNNETGKTRIKDFISWILFSNEDKYKSDKTKKINTLYKNSFKQIDLLTKGEIEILSPSDSSTIFQQVNNGIIENKINPINLDLRHKLIDGISYENYSSIYSLSLDEINESQSKELLSDKSQLEYIFGAVQAKTSASPALLIKTLKDKCDLLFAESSGAKKEINVVLKKIDEIKKEIKVLKAESKEDSELDDKINKLGTKKDSLKNELIQLEKLTIKQKTKLQNIDIYEKYKDLKNIRTKDFNEKIVKEINEIEVLLKQANHLQSDEKEIAILEKEISELDEEITRLTNRLDATLKPDSTTPYLLSHEFESQIESELVKQTRTIDSIERLSNDVKNIESKIRLSEKQLEFQKQAPKEYVNPPTAKGEISEVIDNKTKKVVIPVVVLFTLLIVLGIIALSAILITAGITALIGTGISYLLFVKNKEAQVPILENAMSLQIEIEHNKEELKNKLSEINLLNKDTISGSEVYKSNCIKAGFDENIEPKHVQKYLKDFQTLSSTYTQVDKIKKQLSKHTNRIKTYYQNIQILAVKTNYSSSADSFMSITHAQHWVETFKEYALEQKELFENKAKYFEELVKLENRLSEQFDTLENAIQELSNNSKSELIVDLSHHENEINDIKIDLENTIHELGTLEEKKKNLNQSTKIQDLLVEQETYTNELSMLHEKYKLAFTSLKIAENAFKKWQENFQPEVTKKASELYHKMTNNKWSTIQTDIDNLTTTKAQQSLFSVKNDNAILDSNKLSRGASEQLFLAFRLAVIQTNKRAPHIPVMLDDISVNFDKTRFDTIAPIIKDLAEQRQVFYYTCHEWVKDILVEKADAKVFKL